LFLVDISGSMGDGHLGLARKAAVLLLKRAYVHRDRVAVVAFRNRKAELLVPPTLRAETVSRTLTALTCGGLTPLGPGLAQAIKTLHTARSRDAELETFLILLSDGRANVGSRPGYERMMLEIETLAAALAGLPRQTTLFFDTTEQGKEDVSARRLSELLKARRFLLWKMVRHGRDPAEELTRTVTSG
jgi:magnesium chelatase subunit D